VRHLSRALLARKPAHLTRVPGIGLTTAIVVVAENNGFIPTENERQLASYAGLDVVQCQGGLSGLGYAHAPMGQCAFAPVYPPAVSSLRYNPQQMVLCPLAGPPA